MNLTHSRLDAGYWVLALGFCSHCSQSCASTFIPSSTCPLSTVCSCLILVHSSTYQGHRGQEACTCNHRHFSEINARFVAPHCCEFLQQAHLPVTLTSKHNNRVFVIQVRMPRTAVGLQTRAQQAVAKCQTAALQSQPLRLTNRPPWNPLPRPWSPRLRVRLLLYQQMLHPKVLVIPSWYY